MAYNICIVADSRGARLQPYLNRFNTWHNISYSVIVLRGRKIAGLWETTRSLLLNKEADFVYVYGGICDLTSPFYTREGRKFWMAKQPREMICDLILAMNEICDEAINLNLYDKLAFIQEMGCDLIRYNRVRRPAKWMIQQQNEFDQWLPALHRSTKDINYNLGVRTPWVLDSIYKHDHRRRFYPRYNLLADGLHPTSEIASRIAEQIIKDVSEAHA